MVFLLRSSESPVILILRSLSDYNQVQHTTHLRQMVLRVPLEVRGDAVVEHSKLVNKDKGVIATLSATLKIVLSRRVS